MMQSTNRQVLFCPVFSKNCAIAKAIRQFNYKKKKPCEQQRSPDYSLLWYCYVLPQMPIILPPRPCNARTGVFTHSTHPPNLHPLFPIAHITLAPATRITPSIQEPTSNLPPSLPARTVPGKTASTPNTPSTHQNLDRGPTIWHTEVLVKCIMDKAITHIFPLGQRRRGRSITQSLPRTQRTRLIIPSPLTRWT